MNQEYLDQIPPRHPSETDATVHQLTFLWNAGYQDHDYLATLGREQARWLIARNKGEDPDAASSKKRRWVFSWKTLLALLLLVGGTIAWLGLSEVPPLPGEKAPVREETAPGAAPEAENGRSIIDPTRSRRLSFSSIKENLQRRFRREPHAKPTPALRPGQRVTSEKIEAGKDYVLKRPVGVQVKEGVIVLQVGSRIAITEVRNDRVTFQHPFGHAEAGVRELLPEPSPSPSPVAKTR
ncbi:MAG TPA: hypothetical protein VNQ90_06260 [Chthoniobacteraceae bacterium]|nr:hypothetical protein [Chthoniobacteraceae bacterium]